MVVITTLVFLVFGPLVRALSRYQLSWASLFALFAFTSTSALLLFRFLPWPKAGVGALCLVLIPLEMAVVLEVWAFIKLRPFRMDIAYYQTMIRRYHQEFRELPKRRRALARQISTVKKQYAQALAQETLLAALLQEYSAQDADNRTVLVRAWLGGNSNFPIWKLHLLSLFGCRAKGRPKSAFQEEDLRSLMQALAAKHACIQAVLEERLAALRRWEDELIRCNEEEGELKKRLNRAEEALKEAREAYRAHKARLRLD